MPASNDSAAPKADLDEQQVREYLKQNGDFLKRNPDMLDYLHISHASGSAVSLVEKQVGVLRERNIEMRRRLTSLTNNARDNDKLYEKTRTLVLELLDADSPASISQSFLRSMRDDFETEHATLILFGDSPRENCRVDSADRARIEIGGLLNGDKAVCGTLRQEELKYLFPKSEGVGSAAVAPLYTGREELGLIAVGSSDANRYSGSMGTLFLTYIAEIVVRLLPHLTQR